MIKLMNADGEWTKTQIATHEQAMLMVFFKDSNKGFSYE